MEPRTYAGKWAFLAIVGAVVALVIVLNVVDRTVRDDPSPRPTPTIVTVTP